MKVQTVYFLEGKKFYEIDANGIQQKIKQIEQHGASLNQHAEYAILKCFKDINYCMKRCMEFEAKDVFAQKSCKDCLEKYIHEIKKLNDNYYGGK